MGTCQDLPGPNRGRPCAVTGVLLVLKLFQPRVLSILLLESKQSQELSGVLQRMQGLQGLKVFFIQSALWTQRLFANLFIKNGAIHYPAQHVLPNSSGIKAIGGHSSSKFVIPYAELVDLALIFERFIGESAKTTNIQLCKQIIETRKQMQHPLQSCKIIWDSSYMEEKPGLELISSHEGK